MLKPKAMNCEWILSVGLFAFFHLEKRINFRMRRQFMLAISPNCLLNSYEFQTTGNKNYLYTRVQSFHSTYVIGELGMHW